MKLLAAIFRFFLSLRYKIDVKGLELLHTGSSKLILPNHQATVDPQILFTQIYRKTTVVPVVSELYFNIPVLKTFFKSIGAVPVSELSAGNRDLNVLNTIYENVNKALNNGSNVLLYPAGQISGQGYEKIFNKQSAWSIVSNMPNDAQVIAVRISGLWGSMWSRAWMGEAPNFLDTALKSIFYIIVNLFFFLPKRRVSIEFINITRQAKLQAKEGRLAFNNYLESVYNVNGEEPVNYIKHYFFASKLNRSLPERIKGSVNDMKKSISDVETEISEETFNKVVEILTKDGVLKADEISLKSSISLDLNIDSLGLVGIIAAIEEEFNYKVKFEITDVKYVSDLCLIAMGIGIDNDELKPCNLHVHSQIKEDISIDANKTIVEAFLESFSKNPQEGFTYDKMLGETNRKTFMLKAMVVSKLIRNEVPSNYVGIMLPALQSTTLLVMATYLAGKTPVMLNWTVGKKVLDHTVNAVKLTHILTAKSFYDRVEALLSDDVKAKCIFFEKKVQTLPITTKLSGILSYLLKSKPKTKPDDIAVILFTSGSESLPKAVPLTHRNIMSDLSGAFSSIKITNDKVFLSFLPPFHSFGFSVLTVLPLVTGVKIAYTPDPTDNREVLRILKHTKANVMMTTPTFLKLLLGFSYLQELKSLDLVITGAESLHSSIIEQFKLKTEGRALLLEGYGITECSPILTINPLEEQKERSVGKFINGVNAIIADINSFKPLEQGKEGMILVNGPNVFHGYLNHSIANSFVEIDGKSYYRTEDLGYLDQSGFLFITGRLKRFIKIAGEMISLPAIENTLLIKYGTQNETVLAIEGNDKLEVPLIVLFSKIPIDLNEANAYLKASGYSNLVKLHKLIQIDEIPLLGTGKTDYKVLKAMIV